MVTSAVEDGLPSAVVARGGRDGVVERRGDGHSAHAEAHEEALVPGRRPVPHQSQNGG